MKEHNLLILLMEVHFKVLIATALRAINKGERNYNISQIIWETPEISNSSSDEKCNNLWPYDESDIPLKVSLNISLVFE